MSILSQIEHKIVNQEKITCDDLAHLVTEDKEMALAIATEYQVLFLIDQNVLTEDDYARWDDLQEEMRCEMAALNL